MRGVEYHYPLFPTWKKRKLQLNSSTQHMESNWTCSKKSCKNTSRIEEGFQEMKSVKNKTTQENREFWCHVESVAQRVRSSPTYANHKMTDGSRSSSSEQREAAESIENDDEQGLMP